MKQEAPYKTPEYEAEAFNCPHCGAYAEQRWLSVVTGILHGVPANTGVTISGCRHCYTFAIWDSGKLVFPLAVTSPKPSTDLPPDIIFDYNEAASIATQSPRGAAALLRLAIQKLCKHLKQPGQNINDDIAGLVKLGLPVKVQQSLDIVRVVGNNAVHPGQIDLKDDETTVGKLFGLINLIASVMITQPKEIDGLYETVIPKSAREAIDRRDGKKGPEKVSRTL